MTVAETAYSCSRSLPEDSRVGVALARNAAALLDVVEDHERELRISELHEAGDAWREIPTAARESRLFQVLGDERLIIRELTKRLNDALGYSSEKGGRSPRAVRE